MPPQSLREFIDILRNNGELAEVDVSVNRELEITEIAIRMVENQAAKSGGPALFFSNVRDYDIPLLINAFASEKKVCLALGVNSIAELQAEIGEMTKGEAPAGFKDKLKALFKLRRFASLKPKLVKSGPCQEVILKGRSSGLQPSLAKFPILKCWPEDAGQYITLPCIISKDPETGRRNVGIYRMQVFDERTTGMHWHLHKHGAFHYRKASLKGKPLEVAVAIGAEPAVTIAACAPLPEGMDELLLAGFLMRKPVPLVKCQTVDLEVPASSEIVLEGVVYPEEQRSEGPFGDHRGYYSLAEPFPVFHINCITHRRNPIYQTTVTGRPPTEDYCIGQAAARIFLPLLKALIPELIDMSFPPEGVFHNLVIVSIRKQYPWQARKVMHTLWGFGQLIFSKIIVVVDENVDVHNLSDVLWTVGNNIDPKWDLVISEGPVDMLDHSARRKHLGTKVGIDATVKLPEEGFHGKWPAEIVMSQEIKELVDRKWKEYGF